MSEHRFAKTPEPPYYAVIFTSQRTAGDDGYGAMASAMHALALEQHGCLGAESTRDADGLGITVAYFTDEALKDFAASLGPLDEPQEFTQVSQSSRGGMTFRAYIVKCGKQTLRVWIFETPDGKLDQLQVSGEG